MAAALAAAGPRGCSLGDSPQVPEWIRRILKGWAVVVGLVFVGVITWAAPVAVGIWLALMAAGYGAILWTTEGR